MDVESIVEKHTHLQNYSLRTLSLSAGHLERARTVKDRRLEDHACEVIDSKAFFVCCFRVFIRFSRSLRRALLCRRSIAQNGTYVAPHPLPTKAAKTNYTYEQRGELTVMVGPRWTRIYLVTRHKWTLVFHSQASRDYRRLDQFRHCCVCT